MIRNIPHIGHKILQPMLSAFLKMYEPQLIYMQLFQMNTGYNILTANMCDHT